MILSSMDSLLFMISVILSLVPDDTGTLIALLSPSPQFPWRSLSPSLPAIILVIVFHVLRWPGAVAVGIF